MKAHTRRPGGLTEKEENQLRDALARLHAVNRPAYLGGRERFDVDQGIKAIEARLNPKSVDDLLAATERVCTPIEYLFANIDREAHAAAIEVCG